MLVNLIKEEWAEENRIVEGDCKLVDLLIGHSRHQLSQESLSSQ